ncbi:hypothetical protein SBV1_1300017 [Verrucomicrobia bacterium]|nr:hypothetical protein SBV1_1300017 [Verrucomicrobiota bacterium]
MRFDTGALTGLQRLLGRLTWGCARRTRYTPVYYIYGLSALGSRFRGREVQFVWPAD